jgi:PiT family inorganic phosphate transporter
METTSLSVVIFLICLALLFDFLNGLHDAANSIATVVSTRVLSPKYAVLWAAFFNFIAFIFFDQQVAKTIGTGIIDVKLVDTHLVFGALAGAIVWNVATWIMGLPSSSSHALIGGLVGSAVAKSGTWSSIGWKGLGKTGAAIIGSPLAGYILAMLFMIMLAWAFRTASPYFADRAARRMQLVSAALYSLGHGGNDAQKVMGVITMLLFSQGMLTGAFHVPFWVVIACQAAMGLGTMMGGWRIVKTMGSGLTDLRPVQGACAEMGGALTLFGASALGIPVSTTHTITGAIIGVGAIVRPSAVRWGTAKRIVWAWIITIPAAASVAWVCYKSSLLFW